MKPRLVRPVLCTVRPLRRGAGDVLGDRTAVNSALRAPAIERVRIQVTHTSGTFRQGQPGVDHRVTALGILHDDWGWEPSRNDLVEMPDGRKLFVVDCQPAMPRAISLGRPSGGFYGWRISLTNLSPEVNPAARHV